MKTIKRVISFILILSVLLSLSTSVFAEGKETSAMDRIEELIDKLSDITAGDPIRHLAAKTGYKDNFHVISATGEPVTLEMGFLTEMIQEILTEYGLKYTCKYQWYSCNGFKEGLKCIDNENGSAFTTASFEEPGLQYYVCKISLRRKLGPITISVKSFLSPLYVAAYTGLPVVYVNTKDGEYILSKEEWLEDASVSVVDPSGEYSLDDVTAKVKGRGNSTWRSSSKGGYTVKFDSKQNLFGLGADKKWALVGNFGDKSLMRNYLASELDKVAFDDGSEFNVTHKHIELVINGEYRGSFTLATPIKLGDYRVDVPDISGKIKKDLNGDGVKDYYDAGFLLEIDNHVEDVANYFVSDIANVMFCLSDPDLEDDAENNEAIFNHIQTVVQTAENVIYSENFTDPEEGYAKYIDVDSFIDWYLLEELSKNTDGKFNLSTFMYFQPSDGKLHMTSCWDFDLAFGNMNDSECTDPEGFYCNEGWYKRLLQDPVFAARVADRWDEVRDSVVDVLENTLPEYLSTIEISAKMNFAKWPELGLYTWPHAPGWWLRWSYSSEISYLVDWTEERIDWLDSEGIPSLRQYAADRMTNGVPTVDTEDQYAG